MDDAKQLLTDKHFPSPRVPIILARDMRIIGNKITNQGGWDVNSIHHLLQRRVDHEQESCNGGRQYIQHFARGFLRWAD